MRSCGFKQIIDLLIVCDNHSPFYGTHMMTKIETKAAHYSEVANVNIKMLRTETLAAIFKHDDTSFLTKSYNIGKIYRLTEKMDKEYCLGLLSCHAFY